MIAWLDSFVRKVMHNTSCSMMHLLSFLIRLLISSVMHSISCIELVVSSNMMRWFSRMRVDVRLLMHVDVLDISVWSVNQEPCNLVVLSVIMLS